jgi:hypothetical protein
LGLSLRLAAQPVWDGSTQGAWRRFTIHFGGGSMATSFGELRPIDGGPPIPLVEDRILIGSHRYCDIVIRSVDVAPLHCQLTVHGASWHVRDFTGTDDTRVNSLVARDERLVPGDVLWVGTAHKYEVCYDPELLATHIPIISWPGDSNTWHAVRWRTRADRKPRPSQSGKRAA